MEMGDGDAQIFTFVVWGLVAMAYSMCSAECVYHTHWHPNIWQLALPEALLASHNMSQVLAEN